jgi:hypothetical protein
VVIDDCADAIVPGGTVKRLDRTFSGEEEWPGAWSGTHM